MSKLTKYTALAISLIMVAVLVAGCSSRFTTQSGKEGPSSGSSSSAPAKGLAQTSTEGSVTIDVKWVKTEGDLLIFDVSMNTHSVDLDRYDLEKLAILRDDTGNEYRPASWDSPAGGHHRTGTLVFPLPDSVRQGKAKYVEMVIRDIAGIKERVLKWEL
ncbi:MAG: hypothetical protein HY663_01195 [Chloroflexi bacterium]|nr:hypothetical protein [Chloroflexota bacterium]